MYIKEMTHFLFNRDEQPAWSSWLVPEILQQVTFDQGTASD